MKQQKKQPKKELTLEEEGQILAEALNRGVKKFWQEWEKKKKRQKKK